MMEACLNGQVGVFQWLIDNGAAADNRTPDNYKRTPMMIAIDSGHLNSLLGS